MKVSLPPGVCPICFHCSKHSNKMTGRSWLIVSLTGLFCSVLGKTVGPDSTVISPLIQNFTDVNFEHDTQIGTGMTAGSFLIKFYAPWCGYCKAMYPVWNTLAEELKGEVTVGRVDATENRLLAERFSIKSYPTILFFKNSKMYTPTDRSRDPQSFVDFVRENYKQTEARDIPKGPSLYTKLVHRTPRWMTTVAKDIHHMWFKERTALAFVIISSVVTSFIVGFTVSTFLQFYPTTVRNGDGKKIGKDKQH